MSEPIVLWGRESSANTQKVLWCLLELGIPFERRDVGGKFGGLDRPEFLAMNPNRRIPVIQDGSLTLWESHACVRYLAAKYGAGTIWPVDLAERAIVDQWTDWVATDYQNGWLDLFWAFVRTPPSKRDAARVADALNWTHRTLKVLDARLAESPYVGGPAFTYADIVSGISLFRLATMGIELPPVPNIDAWHQRLRQRAPFRQAVEINYDELIGREVS
ncbi:MAG: glutathione S-transferase family protein [Hyphomicrobiaceae bacterium]|nr:glutathione S-transferase family protein [Hyphomicrobiaceae bacterium]